MSHSFSFCILSDGVFGKGTTEKKKVSPTINHDQMRKMERAIWFVTTYILSSEFLSFQKSAEDCWIEVICVIISSFLTWNHEASFKLEQHSTLSINTSMSPETQKQYWHMMTIPSCSGVVRVWLNNQGNGTNNYKLQWIRQSKDSPITVLSSYL